VAHHRMRDPGGLLRADNVGHGGCTGDNTTTRMSCHTTSTTGPHQEWSRAQTNKEHSKAPKALPGRNRLANVSRWRVNALLAPQVAVRLAWTTRGGCGSASQQKQPPHVLCTNIGWHPAHHRGKAVMSESHVNSPNIDCVDFIVLLLFTTLTTRVTGEGVVSRAAQTHRV